MDIKNVIARFGGIEHDANKFWPDGASDDRERIVELPWHVDYQTFETVINGLLSVENPIQYIADSDDNKSRFFLYYAE